MGDLGWILGLGRSPGEGKGYPLQYSGLENSMDCIVHGVAKSWTRLSDFHFDYMLTGFPGGAIGKEPACQCRRQGFDPWVSKIPWRRAWHPTPVFLPGEFYGQRSLAGYSPYRFRVRHDSSNLARTCLNTFKEKITVFQSKKN